MPFKDAERYREYMRRYMREYNKLKREALKLLREHGDKIEKALGIKVPPAVKRKRRSRRRRRKK